MDGTLDVHDRPPGSRQHGHRSTGSMEAFASIALATQQGGGFWSSEKRSLHDDHSTDRAKRLRVEPSHPNINPATQSVPTTNNDFTSSVQLHEAKLLLHFSQQARDTHQHPPHDPRNGSPSIAHPKETVSISASGHDTVSKKEETQFNSPAKEVRVADVQGQTIPSGVSNPEITPYPSSLPSMEQIARDRGTPKSLTHSPRLMKDSKILPNDVEDNILSHDIPIHASVNKVPAAAEQTTIERVPSVSNVNLGLDLIEEPPSPSKDGPNEASEIPQPSSRHFFYTDDKEGTKKRTGMGNVSGSMDTGLNGIITGSQQAPSTAQQCSNDPSLTDPTDNLSASTNVMEAASSRSSDPPTNSTAICEACRFWRNSLNVDTDSTATSWIHCDGCKSWFHFACAGFKNEREVRSIDKYRCKKCKPIHGATTHVRKSARAHAAIDYAGLHQGVLKTSDDRPEHHYIQPIRSGKISFMPEHFPRMRPELVTADFFEKGNGMREPVVIPAALNPQPGIYSSQREQVWSSSTDLRPGKGIESSVDLADWLAHDTETRSIHDCGQDALGMVMPQDLTVRKVAELYGPEEKVEVIDVKSQNGEGRKWNMRRWANYYESSQDNKIIRNVISLEVSQSRLGRLIRRPQIVRDLDLQDSVWPEELLAKGEYPHVQFYCLMSVADCFTDFHIDFGGSSVFYHILKGRKTFLFIPPKEKHLKKYEEWCMSPAQNWTFLPDQTHECYRVDLEPGDTMLIPSGWIHAVWTPEDSLVIGGNFLTRMNYTMQFRVLQVEKATGVARKFRYPHFQKLHWFTVFQYLEDDPVPASVREHLENGFSFERASNTYRDFDEWGENSRSGPENYHARYYPQQELDGLPDLLRYVLRTALIDNGIITEGISADARNAVKKSIPRNRGEPLHVVKTFAIWCSWKRGKEPIPHWAYPDAVMESAAPDKLSAAATKKLAEEAAQKAPRRQSLRKHAQREGPNGSQVNDDNPESGTENPLLQPINMSQEQNNERVRHVDECPASRKPRHTNTPSGPQRKTACDSCRRRRRACKHKSNGDLPSPADQQETSSSDMVHQEALLHRNALQEKLSSISGLFSSLTAKSESNQAPISRSTSPQEHARAKTTDQTISEPPGEAMTISTESSTEHHADTRVDNSSSPRPRTKACNHCRKSKVSASFPIVHMYSLTSSSGGAFTTHLERKIQSKLPSRRSQGRTLGNYRDRILS